MKITGPLFSKIAQGTINNLLIFSRRNGLNIARNFHKPYKPATAAQVSQRNTFQGIIAQWRTLSAAEKAVWILLLGRHPFISAYHYFFSAPSLWRRLRMFGNGKFGQVIFGSLKTKV